MSKQEYYDEYWKNYWIKKQNLSSFEKKILKKYSFQNKKILDVGCGDGEHIGKPLSKLTKNLYGIELSTVAARKASKYYANISIQDSQKNFNYADNSFDFVFSLEHLEHLFDPEETMQEIYRVLKPGGKFILSVPNTVYYRERIMFLFGIFNPRGCPYGGFRHPWRDAHIRFFTVSSMKKALTISKFKKIKYFGTGGIYLLYKIYPSLFSDYITFIVEK